MLLNNCITICSVLVDCWPFSISFLLEILEINYWNCWLTFLHHWLLDLPLSFICCFATNYYNLCHILGGSGISGSADGACAADDVECAELHDRLGMEAIRSLHQQLDDDDNGNIDLSESDDVRKYFGSWTNLNRFSLKLSRGSWSNIIGLWIDRFLSPFEASFISPLLKSHSYEIHYNIQTISVSIFVNIVAVVKYSFDLRSK